MHKSLLHAHLFSNWCIGFEAIISKHQKNMSNMHSIHPFWVVQLKCGHSPAKKTTACTWGFVFHKLLGGKTSYEKWTYYVKICNIWNPYFKIFFCRRKNLCSGTFWSQNNCCCCIIICNFLPPDAFVSIVLLTASISLFRLGLDALQKIK